MASPTLTDEQLEKEYGRRPEGQALDYPFELGYRCPVGHIGEDLCWSEFKEHIWCPRCKKDYHYAVDCQLMRMCWYNDEQWKGFLNRLPMKPKILEGIQHFPDCKIPHKKERRNHLEVG